MKPTNSSNSSKGGNTNSPLVVGKKQVSPAKNWCFTLNNYDNEDIKTICSISSSNCKNYIFQEERGEGGTKHLQGFCEFITKVRPMSVFKSLVRIHWEKCKGTKQQNIDYCSKEATRDGKIFTNIKLPKPIKIISKLKPWQESIVEIIKKEPDDRAIYWYWETMGGIGKSVFCKYLCVKYGAIVLSGKSADMKYAIMKYKEKNGVYPEIIILDIPRSNLNYLSYTGIEEVKNGCFFSSKYECDQVIMNCPHIICFANSPPEEELISADRWHIKEL